MLASLPMYTTDRDASEALWVALATVLRVSGMQSVPDALTWPDDLHTHWRRPDMLLSQTCGYPLVYRLSSEVRVIGAFGYTAAGCDGARYRSVLIARADDPGRDLAAFRGRRAAYNSPDSQSGYNCLRALVAPFAVDGRFFGATVATGAHRASMRAVAEAKADIAAIDCITFAGVCAVDPTLASALKVVGYTASAPGLPLITRGAADDSDIADLRRALGEVAADPALADVRKRLMIGSFAPLDLSAYDEIAAMEQAAIAAGYPVLG